MPNPDPAKETIKAAKKGDATTLRALLVHDGGLARITEADGTTPLHCAAWKGHVEIVEILLDAGAEIDALNQDAHYGGTPLHAAAHGNQKAVVEVLLKRGADFKVVSCNGRTPLQETDYHKATAAAKLLKQAGATE
jgi:ankyrin repeat protein